MTGPVPYPGVAPVVGVLGELDGEAVSGHLAARVIRADLGRRWPPAAVVALAPQPRPGALDGGEPVEALGPWTGARRAELAGRFDAVAVLGPGPGRQPGPRGPAAGAGTDNARAPGPSGVPDAPAPERSERYLLDGLGAEHEAECPSIAPDQAALATLAASCLPCDVLDRRLAWLSLMGWYPSSGRCLLLSLEGRSNVGPFLGEVVSRVSRDHRDLAVVAIGAVAQQLSGPPVDALGPRLAVLTGALSLEDVAAVHRGAAVVVGGSPAGQGLSLAYGRPFVALDGLLANDLEAAIEAALVQDADPTRREGALSGQQRLARAQLDALAAAALASVSARAGAGRAGYPRATATEPDHASSAAADLGHWAAAARRARSAQQAARRLARAEWVHQTIAYRAELEARLAQLRLESADGYARHEAEIDALRGDLGRCRADRTDERAALLEALTGAETGRDRLERELQATHATRLFRWASGPRRVYGAVRRRWRRGPR